MIKFWPRETDFPPSSLNNHLCREVSYECPAGEVFDDGSSAFSVACRLDGSYAPVAAWPECRQPASCNDTVPAPVRDG